MITDHLTPLRCAIHDRKMTPPSSPWIEAARYCVAGLFDIGFHRDSELLLVVSSSGRGVFDCLTGAKIARDYADDVLTDA
ncbi:hypothetical protein [Pseudomonas eucalypticola]|uniref:Uncharacterized protein n=1 Tax=Pseudomonas eucalypticola TaxID=2599595 RepID=A0A7D5H4V5_9PSED|nr:hypothetical protein [Pseudomonas eucalypticola]QKZ04049.1 hypothetical protein HWQ56_09745 [Pseudomonas eucalypticola]